MTPLKNHNPPRSTTPKQRFFHLIEIGMTEDAAERISGYNERREILSALRSWAIWAAAVGIVTVAAIVA